MLKRHTPGIILCFLLVLFAEVISAQNQDVNRRDREGRTALMRAAADGRVDEVKELIAAHAKLEMKDPLGQTALARAATMGHGDIVRLLISAGGGKDVKKDQETFVMAAKRGYPDVVKALLEAGADKETHFYYKTSFNRMLTKEEQHAFPPGKEFGGTSLAGRVLAIKSAQACPSCEIVADISGDICETALTYGALEGSRELVKVMLDAGATPSGCGDHFEGVARRFGEFLLVDVVAQLNGLKDTPRFITVSLGETALEAAASRKNNEAIVNLLVAAGAK
jgi:ankyrin repeat protein